MMTKKKVILIPLTVVCFLAILIVLKLVIGVKIVHYKQYFIPCRGQVVYCTEISPDVQFPLYAWDEEEISELADKENIKSITFETSDNKELKASSWSVEKIEDFAMSKLYAQGSNVKQLNISLPVASDCTLEKMSIRYLDATETFDIGEVKLVGVEADSIHSSLSILPGIRDALANKRGMKKGIHMCDVTCLQLFMVNNYSELCLEEIDLGTDDIQVDMEHYSFRDDGVTDISELEKDEILGADRGIDDAVSKGSIPIPLGDSMIYQISLCKSEAYPDNLVCYYLNPLCTLTTEDGTVKIWGDAQSCTSITPYVYGDEALSEIKEILEKSGK